MAAESMFPLPKEHWLPFQGVKQCMCCASSFPKTLFGSSKDNCRKCGRVVCKTCLKYKIQDVRICTECHQQMNEAQNAPPKAISIATKSLYTEYEQRCNNPYLSEESLTTYQQQFNLRLPSAPTRSDRTRTRSHSATSTIATPHSLLDRTTNIPLPSNNAPTDSIPFHLKEVPEHDDKEEKELILQRHKSSSSSAKRKSFRQRKNDFEQTVNREQSVSVSSKKSINVIPWIEDEDLFEINLNAMKTFEDKTYTRAKIKGTEPMIVRLDGFGFGLFTSNMKKPFDRRLHSALVMTACDLLKRFEAYTVFVQSDEIILIYPTTHHKIKGCYLFGGKIAKIVSIMASFASVRFVHHLQKEVFDENVSLQKEIRNCFVSFNGKCFNVSDNSDLFDYILWRLRANISGYHKKILTADTEFCHGTFIKKEKYINNAKKKERERITSCCVEIQNKDTKYLKLIVDKYWNNEFLDKENTLKLPPNANKDRNKLSFDDDDVFPDIYSTVLIHNGDTLRRNVPSLTQNVIRPLKLAKIKDALPKRKSLPIQQRDVFAIARQFSALSKQDMMAPTDAKPKQKLKKKAAKKVDTTVVKKEEQKIQKEAVEIKNNIYDENNIYETMIIHDMDEKTNSAQIVKPKAKQKKFLRPKKKAYHRPPSMGKVGSKTRAQPQLPPNKPLPKSISPQSISPEAISPTARQIIKPAAANPNYQYNYNIHLSDVTVKSGNKQKVKVKKNENEASAKPMSAKERIRFMNERLQKMKQ